MILNDPLEYKISSNLQLIKFHIIFFSSSDVYSAVIPLLQY